MTCLIATIIGAGIFGGTVNFFQLYSKENKGWINYCKCVIIGLGASFLVPLFLQMISSNLIESSYKSDKDLLVFLGFCLIASIFSKRFIETIGEKILKQVEEVKLVAESAKEIAETNKEEVGFLTSKSTEVDEADRITPENETTTTTTSSTTTTTTTDAPDTSTNIKSRKDEIKNVLLALRDPTFTFRTLTGIAEDSGLSEEAASLIINYMVSKKWVKEFRKGEKVLYAITEFGNKIKILIDD